MSWVDLLGYAASLSVLATFCMSTMLPLRVVALVSNVLFGACGAIDHIYPVMLLHLVLFPINAARLIQILRLVRKADPAREQEFSMESVLPSMRRRELRAGEVLMRKGDAADRLYYLTQGELEAPEIRSIVGAGSMVGEIGLFAPDRRRTLTVLAKTDCVVYERSETKVSELYFQNPRFGYAVLKLIVSRLLAAPRPALGATT